MENIIYSILGLIVFIIVLGVIVLIHEGGHFFFARKAKILCHEFSIGMGPQLFHKKKGETVYSIRAIPIGGYVSMAGEEVEDDILKGVKKVKIMLDNNNRVNKIIVNVDNPLYKNLPIYNLGTYNIKGTMEALPDELFINVTLDQEGAVEENYIVNRDAMVNAVKKEEIQIAPIDRGFASKTLGQRFISVFAGPLMNFVLAIAVFFVMGLAFGYSDTSKTKVSEVSGVAESIGLEDGDVIKSINGIEVNKWNDITTVMNNLALGNIDADGKIKVTYLDASNGNQLVEKEAYPMVYVISSDLICHYDDTLKAVVIDSTSSSFESTKLGQAGLLPGDVIKSIEYYSGSKTTSCKSGEVADPIGKETINGIDDLLKFFTSTVGSNLYVEYTVSREVEEQGKTNIEEVVSELVEIYSKEMLESQSYNQTKLVLGISPGITRNIGKLVYMPFVTTGKAVAQVINTLKLLFNKSSGVSVTDLSGPVGIYNLFTQLVKGEDAVYNILYWTGMLSVNIGLVNLFPLPALDGGRLAFMVYEGITKKKPSAKVENTIHNIGFILLMALFVVVAISDVITCFKG